MSVSVHIIECCWCHSDQIKVERNSEGHYYCRCRNCGIKFWHLAGP